MRYDSDYYNFTLVPYANSPTYSGQAGATPKSAPAKNSDQQAEGEEDNYEKLMKLVDLYEDGLISEEEFETEKAKIFEK